MTASRRRPPSAPGPFADPEHAAHAAALRYVSDDQPGIRRIRAGKGFRYRDAADRAIRAPGTLRRIQALAIPPAWSDVWICPLDQGHIQATGRDARGRKQYRYHARWRQVRDETKYQRMASFGAALPAIRRRIHADMARPGIPRERVLGTVIELLETTFIRVGNDEYARTNKSFGLTTLKDRHVDVAGNRIRFHFRGKSGKEHVIDVTDRRLARRVRECRDLPGQHLFQYLDDAGEPHPVNSADVNEYLRDISGEDFTAKDFRTWAGTLLAAQQLAQLDGGATGTGSRSALPAIALVAERLGNTVAVCRKCYIHPAVLAAYQDRAVFDRWSQASARVRASRGLQRDEVALLRFLKAMRRHPAP